MKKITVTIGIPAFNEQANISFLLNDLLGQEQTTFRLEKIIVYSDASTDQTVVEASRVKDSRIDIIEGKDRQGVGAGTNILMAASASDIFILLNADIVIIDKQFIQKLITPIINDRADLVSGNLQPLPAENFFENILFTSMAYKRSVFESYNKGGNLFTCYGPIRAFSKRLYKKIIFKESVADDMYSYFFCIYHGFNYVYAKAALAFFKLPNNFKDYRKQSTRYWSSATLFSEFGEKFINTHYLLPKKLFVIKGLVTFLHHPLYATLYPVLPLTTRFESFFKKSLRTNGRQNTWAIAASSKVMRGKI